MTLSTDQWPAWTAGKLTPRFPADEQCWRFKENAPAPCTRPATAYLYFCFCGVFSAPYSRSCQLRPVGTCSSSHGSSLDLAGGAGCWSRRSQSASPAPQDRSHPHPQKPPHPYPPRPIETHTHTHIYIQPYSTTSRPSEIAPDHCSSSSPTRSNRAKWGEKLELILLN